MLLRATDGQSFYNLSKLNFESILADPAQVQSGLVQFIQGFSPNARDILEHFRFEAAVSTS